MKELLEVFELNHGYHCLDSKDQYTYFVKKEGLRAIFKDFVYPTDILQFVTHLSQECENYKLNGESCEDSCTSLNKYPILRTDHIKFQIMRLERK